MLNNYTAKTLKAVRDILIQSTKFSRAYWWSPQPNANSRREMERYESRPTIEWDESGHHYTARFDVVCHYSYTEGKRLLHKGRQAHKRNSYPKQRKPYGARSQSSGKGE